MLYQECFQKQEQFSNRKVDFSSPKESVVKHFEELAEDVSEIKRLELPIYEYFQQSRSDWKDTQPNLQSSLIQEDLLMPKHRIIRKSLSGRPARGFSSGQFKDFLNKAQSIDQKKDTPAVEEQAKEQPL